MVLQGDEMACQVEVVLAAQTTSPGFKSSELMKTPQVHLVFLVSSMPRLLYSFFPSSHGIPPGSRRGTRWRPSILTLSLHKGQLWVSASVPISYDRKSLLWQLDKAVICQYRRMGSRRLKLQAWSLHGSGPGPLRVCYNRQIGVLYDS